MNRSGGIRIGETVKTATKEKDTIAVNMGARITDQEPGIGKSISTKVPTTMISDKDNDNTEDDKRANHIDLRTANGMTLYACTESDDIAIGQVIDVIDTVSENVVETDRIPHTKMAKHASEGEKVGMN